MRSPEIPERFLNQLARDNRVSEGELKALKLALSKRKSKDIAKHLDISEAAARKRLGEVYRKFGIKGKGPGKLASLEATLGARLVEYDPHLAGELAEVKTTYDWGDAPTLNAFGGQSGPLSQLESWIAEPAKVPKLLAICGIGGIGKSYLARRLTENVGGRFRKVVWLAVDATKPPEDLLRSLQTKLQAHHHPTITLHRSRWAEAEPPPALTDSPTVVPHSADEFDEQWVKQLAAQIAQQCCLIVLDGFDSIFKSYSSREATATQTDYKDKYWVDGPPSDTHRAPTFHVTRQQQASLYKEGFEIYGKLLRALKDCEPQDEPSQTSCLIVTSREKPAELFSFADNDANGKLYTLEGLNELEAEALLKAFCLKGKSIDYRDLAIRYCGHPMALKLSANTVRDVFYGSIRDFLEQDISVFDDLRSILKTQFKRLPPTEKEVMYWLAINHQPCTLEDLKGDIVAKDHKSNVLYTLRSLQRRSLIQIKRKDSIPSFQLHPIVAGYVLDRFIRAVFQDLMRHDLQLFNDHALMKADAEDDIREFQLKNIVHPILERLRNYCKSLYQVEEYLSDRLNQFRVHNPHRLGYAGGNFVNLLVQLSQGERLIGKDFSELTIWQAYLQKVKLQDVSFNRCELERSVFTETFSDVMAIAFSNTPSSNTPSSNTPSSNTPSSNTPSSNTLSSNTLSSNTLSSNTLSSNTLSSNAVSHPQPPLLAAGDASGMVHLWPTLANKSSSQKLTQTCAQKYAQWAAHSGWVRAIAFVPNQSLLVTGGDDNWLRLWRLPTNNSQGLSQPTQVWQKSAYDWVHAVAVSDDGAIIASGGDDKITLYRSHDGRLLHRFADQAGENSQLQAKNRIRALTFSPDGRWLASGGDDCIIRIWPVDKLLQSAGAAPLPIRLTGHKAMVHTLSFSPDSQRLVSGGADKTLRVWDVESGQLKKTFVRPAGQVRSVAISGGGLLASGGDDCRVTLWDLNTLKPIKDFSTGQSRIWSVAFQQQGDKLLLSAGGDQQSLMLWQVEAAVENQQSVSVRPVRTYRGYTNGIRAVAFLSDDRVIGGGDRGELSVWDTQGTRRATLPFHQGRIWSVAVDLQHARIASASDDHTIRLWNTETGQCLTTLTGHNNWVRTVAFSSHGRFLVSGGDDCTIRVWNTASGFCRRVVKPSDAWIRTVEFDPTNSRHLISGGDDQVVRRWDIKEEISYPLAQHDHRICSVAYSRDGTMVASGSDDTTVILYDMKSSQIVYRFANADLGIKAVAFSPNGRYLAAGGDDQLLYLWDLQASSPEEQCVVLRPTDYRGLSGGIRSVAFSPNGRYVISGGLDEMIRIGDLSQMEDPAGQVLRPLIERDRPYENIQIEGIKGLSSLQIENLIALGAVDKTKSLLL